MHSDGITTHESIGSNGRGADGRFQVGNRGGPGSPVARHARKLRIAAQKAIKPTEVRAVLRKLLELALDGDVQAARILLGRVLGPEVAGDIEERLGELEAMLHTKGGLNVGRFTATSN